GSGTRFVAIDANFGLLRRKKAGDSMEPPKHGSRFFITDEEVSNFVNSYNDSTTGFKECNQFKAGDKVRSKSRTSKMDVTGVFGSVCRHESPVLFMNMQHGERLAYSVLLLDKMLNVPASKDQKLNVTYDIACVLFSHLKIRNQDDMLAKMQMKIPIFHCYGHQASCQVVYEINKLS
ncbi:uncharacterized protein LOC117102960, partial [Anneissia japonica]|uniref:uncharacterized protein LOC117102960 n=1 Tax=Anneissia japonica TaxID=1529436 RepID=UPI0014258411